MSAETDLKNTSSRLQAPRSKKWIYLLVQLIKSCKDICHYGFSGTIFIVSKINVFQKLPSLSVLIAMSACTSIAPLDPIIGDTGQPFSDIANTTDVLSYGLDVEIFPQNKSITPASTPGPPGRPPWRSWRSRRGRRPATARWLGCSTRRSR